MYVCRRNIQNSKTLEEIYQIKKIEKKRNEKLALLDKKFMIIKVENYISTATIQIFQSHMITLKYAIEIIFFNQRFTNSRRNRSNDRIQNVINMIDFAANSLIRHQQEFFSQNFRFEQKHNQFSHSVSIVNTYQSRKWTEKQRVQENRDFETERHQHANSLFNETQIYNQTKHDHWCFKYDELDHHEENCTCSKHQWLNFAKKRFIWRATSYNFSTSRNASYSQFRKTYSLSSQFQISYNSIVFETTKYRAWLQINNENVISQFSKSMMSQVTYYTEIHDRDFSFEVTSSVSTLNDSMIHIDRMFQFEQCKSKHDFICKSLKYAFVVSDSKLIFAMIDYDNFEKKAFIYREVNKINFVTLFHENSDDSTVLLNVMKVRKRQKKSSNNSDTEENIQQKRIVDSSVDKLKKKRVKQKRVKKIMKSISKMKEKFEINVKKFFMNNTFTLSIMHLYQISSHFRDEIKRLIIAIRKSRTKKEKIAQIANVQAINANFIAIDENRNIKWITKDYLRIINESFSVFYVLINCNKFDKKNFQIIEISFDLIKVDQKSNLIIINQKLTENLDLKMYSIIKIDSRSIKMIVINDNHHKLHFFVIFHVHVEKINRKM